MDEPTEVTRSIWKVDSDGNRQVQSYMKREANPEPLPSSATAGVMHTAWLEDKWLWGLIGFAGLNLFWATVVGSAPILNAAVGGAMIWAAFERYQDL